MIFTSHDLSTMNSEVFRRDEFWFMLHFAYYTANNHRSEYKKFLSEKFQELAKYLPEEVQRKFIERIDRVE